MDCPSCGSFNDDDASFCDRCSRPLLPETGTAPARTRRTYLFALMLLPVLAAAGIIGYYKFMLPAGVAAFVNGERIMCSELDAEVARVSGRDASATAGDDDPAAARLRYSVLNRMITRRLALQEAHRSGTTVSRDELRQAVSGMQSAFGTNERSFSSFVKKHYGSERAFERTLGDDILISKHIERHIASANAGPDAARSAVDRWLASITRQASVRIALAEQWSAADCSCCGGSSAARPGMQGAVGPAGRPSPGSTQAALDAGIRYWKRTYGDGSVAAQARDLGCHVEVDILKNGMVVRSLRYQDGRIME